MSDKLIQLQCKFICRVFIVPLPYSHLQSFLWWDLLPSQSFSNIALEGYQSVDSHRLLIRQQVKCLYSTASVLFLLNDEDQNYKFSFTIIGNATVKVQQVHWEWHHILISILAVCTDESWIHNFIILTNWHWNGWAKIKATSQCRRATCRDEDLARLRESVIQTQLRRGARVWTKSSPPF